jgi:hypothetical protein
VLGCPLVVTTRSKAKAARLASAVPTLATWESSRSKSWIIVVAAIRFPWPRRAVLILIYGEIRSRRLTRATPLLAGEAAEPNDLNLVHLETY